VRWLWGGSGAQMGCFFAGLTLHVIRLFDEMFMNHAVTGCVCRWWGTVRIQGSISEELPSYGGEGSPTNRGDQNPSNTQTHLHVTREKREG
jgi:hypothetical protein